MSEQGDLFMNNHLVCPHSARTQTLTSECLDCHMQLWNKRKIFVFANSWRRSCHPHRRALQADLQQNNTYNPLSEESKVMIRDMGTVELCEPCETIPKVQCSECLLYWNQGIVCCTCGHLLVESESSQHFHKLRLDAFSIPHYVIKKERPPWSSAR